MSKIVYKIKAVLFDMDGVITNTMPDHYRAWETILKRQGIHVTHLDIYSREGQRGIQSVKELFGKCERPFTLKEAQKILKDKEVLFKRIVRRRFIPGTRQYLKKLHAQNIRLGLVTGTSRHELHQILPKHIYDLFSAIITGSDVKQGKPHPEPFIRCLKALKLKSKEAVVIENAPFGIQAAREAGLKCIALQTSLPEKYLHRANHVFKSIRALKGQVQFRSCNQ